MQINKGTFRQLASNDLLDIVIRIGLIGFIIIQCVRIFAPFTLLMLWALILAVALYPLQRRLAKRVRDRQGIAATLLVLGCILLLVVPMGLLGSSFADHIFGLHSAFVNNTLAIPRPDAAVADWPLVGERLYRVWSAAADNLPEFLQEMQPQIETVLKAIVSAAANTAGSLVAFLCALIIAGVMMAYGGSGSQMMRRILCRIGGPVRGQRLQRLSTATVRSVATGVIGVAFIQALLIGIGFIMAGIPAAGVLALIAMFIGIMQLPGALITLPAIGYLWWAGDGSTTSNIIFTIYLVAAGLADNVLKPLLLGRGVDAPMPIILLGSLGGMISSGIIGLFLGAVILTIGYQIVMEWVGEDAEANSVQPDQADAAQAPTASE